jgi:hypothetical protein
LRATLVTAKSSSIGVESCHGEASRSSPIISPTASEKGELWWDAAHCIALAPLVALFPRLNTDGSQQHCGKSRNTVSVFQEGQPRLQRCRVISMGSSYTEPEPESSFGAHIAACSTALCSLCMPTEALFARNSSNIGNERFNGL